jgi:hypothetical protein
LGICKLIKNIIANYKLGKEVKKDMHMIYVYLIQKGLRTFDSVPENLKPQVKQALIDLDCEYLIPEEK